MFPSRDKYHFNIILYDPKRILKHCKRGLFFTVEFFWGSQRYLLCLVNLAILYHFLESPSGSSIRRAADFTPQSSFRSGLHRPSQPVVIIIAIIIIVLVIVTIFNIISIMIS